MNYPDVARTSRRRREKHQSQTSRKMNPAVAQVFDNPYLCWELCRWHPMVYARLMLVSRRFKNWIDGEEEVLVYDPAARDFRKKTVNKAALKQNYMESWVVTEYKGPGGPSAGYLTYFVHSKKGQTVQDRPSVFLLSSTASVTIKAWQKNGKTCRDKGPCYICNWPRDPGFKPHIESMKQWSDRPEREGPIAVRMMPDRWRVESYKVDDYLVKNVKFTWDRLRGVEQLVATKAEYYEKYAGGPVGSVTFHDARPSPKPVLDFDDEE